MMATIILVLLYAAGYGIVILMAKAHARNDYEQESFVRKDYLLALLYPALFIMVLFWVVRDEWTDYQFGKTIRNEKK